MYLLNQFLSLLNKFKLTVLLLLFSTHQLYYSIKIGTWWDEPYDQLGAKLTIGKIKFLFLGIKTNEYRSDYSSYELYGLFYQLQAFYFSKLATFYKNLNLDFLDIRSETHFVYYLRHIYLHIYFCFGILIIYYLLKKIQSDNFAFLYVLVLILIPSINGYSLFNDKDIPFGLHLFIAFLSYTFFIKKFEENKHLSNKFLFFVGLTFGLVLLIRFNGIAFLILLIASINIQNFRRIKKINYLISNLKIGFFSVIIFLLGSIQGINDYYSYIKYLYWQQFKVPTWFGETIVNGEVFYRSGDVSYIFKIIYYKIPFLYLIFIVFLIFFYKKILKSVITRSALIFLALFSAVYIIFKPAAYNYERQYLFLFFFLSLLVTSSLYFIEKREVKNLFIFGLVASTIFSQSGLGEFKYLYLNELVDESKVSNISEECLELNNCGLWSSDHLSVSGISMADMISNSKYPVFVCAPYHTISIFNQEESLIELDNKFTFNSGLDIVDYTYNRKNVVQSYTGTKVFKNKEIFNNYLNNENITEILIVSEHIISNNGNQCLFDLNKANNLKCSLHDENFVSLRNSKVTVNFMLKCNIEK